MYPCIYPLIVHTACCAKITQLESYSADAGSVCIAIPDPGETYASENKTTNNGDTNYNRKKTYDLHSSPKAENTDRVSMNNGIIDDSWLWTQPDDISVTSAALQYYVVSNVTLTKFWAGESRVPTEMLVPGKHILSYQSGISEDNVSS